MGRFRNKERALPLAVPSSHRKSPKGIFDGFLQSAARIICPLSADKFHTYSLRGIFRQVRALAENGFKLSLRLMAQTLRGFFDSLRALPLAVPFFVKSQPMMVPSGLNRGSFSR